MPALAYLGVRRPFGDCEVLAIDDFDQPGRKLPLRRDLVDHSEEFNWGYHGSGPAQLALALLADHLGDDGAAVALHQVFKRLVIARLDGAIWALNAADIDVALGPSPATAGDLADSPTRRRLLNTLAVLPIAAVAPIGAAAVAGPLPAPLSPLRQAHARWAALKRQLDDLYLAIDERETATGDVRVRLPGSHGDLRNEQEIDAAADEIARRPRVDRVALKQRCAAAKVELILRRQAVKAECERLGLPRLRAELAGTKAAIDRVLDDIYAAPIASVEDVAVFLDVALGEHQVELGTFPDHEDAQYYLAFAARLLQGLRALVPGFDFLALRRYYPEPGRLAFLLGADDDAPPAA